jgi:branched-chain amino acid transport system ATP-binding protein
MSTVNSFLSARSVSFHIGGVSILEDIELNVGEGEFLSVIGPNGAGKSTLVNVLSGAVAPSSGELWFRDEEITRYSPDRRARLGIGRTYQTSSLFPGLTLLENVRLAAQAKLKGTWNPLSMVRRTDKAVERGFHALSLVGLADRCDVEAHSLSHGDKRRLEVAVVMCSDPDVYLFDEPTAGISASEIGDVVDVIERIHQAGHTVVMVEHRMELVMRLSNRVAVMHNGRLLTVEEPAQVMKNELVRTAYLGNPRSREETAHGDISKV